jgi:hypothetical protein
MDRAAQLRVGSDLAARPEVLLSAQAWTSPDRAGQLRRPRPGPRRAAQLQPGRFDALYRRYAGGRPATLTWPAAPDQAARLVPAVDMTCRSGPGGWRSWPSSWSLRGVDDIGHEGLRLCSARRRVLSTDQDREAVGRSGLRGQQEPDPARYGLMDGTLEAQPGDPRGSAWMSWGRSTSTAPGPAVDPWRRWRADATAPAAGHLYPPHGVRHLLAAYDLSHDSSMAHQAAQAPWRVPGVPALATDLGPARSPAGLVLDNDSPHLSTRDHPRIGQWLRPTTPSWPLCPPMPPGSTASRPSSPRWATSLWMAPTTQPHRAGQYDPPLHRLAEPQHL